MNKLHKVLLAVLSVMALASSTLIIDYLLSGDDKQERILTLGAKAEKSNRMGGTSVSYLFHTSSFSFYVTEVDFYNTDEGDEVKMNISPVYNQVNNYQIIDKMDESNSLIARPLIGLILPLLTIGLCVTAYFVKGSSELIWGGLLSGVLTAVMFIIISY
ncbi:MAG: hypothetical protein AAF740_09315 [Bacteroidota bacterium]